MGRAPQAPLTAPPHDPGSRSTGSPQLRALQESAYNCQVASLPTLVVVSGPIGAGKTTLAHQIANAVGCPAICRDEIKEGMAHISPGFRPALGDELTARTLPVFFSVLELLLRAGVTTVADAAFQDHVWRPRLEPLRDLAQLRIVHCVVAADVAFGRALQRSQDNPVRRVHADPSPDNDLADFTRRRDAFQRVSVQAPWIEVDTTDGYQPGLDDIVKFVNARPEGHH
jgi:predicted kinase